MNKQLIGSTFSEFSLEGTQENLNEAVELLELIFDRIGNGAMLVQADRPDLADLAQKIVNKQQDLKSLYSDLKKLRDAYQAKAEASVRKQQLEAELTKMGITVKDGKVRKSDIKAALDT